MRKRVHLLDGDCFKVNSHFNDRQEEGGDLTLGDGQQGEKFGCQIINFGRQRI